MKAAIMDNEHRLAEVEARLQKVEQRLAMMERGGLPGLPLFVSSSRGSSAEVREEVVAREGPELEFVLGQTWFAHAGILLLAIGAALLDCLEQGRIAHIDCRAIFRKGHTGKMFGTVAIRKETDLIAQMKMFCSHQQVFQRTTEADIQFAALRVGHL